MKTNQLVKQPMQYRFIHANLYNSLIILIIHWIAFVHDVNHLMSLCCDKHAWASVAMS